jgi:hypothetical protein
MLEPFPIKGVGAMNAGRGRRVGAHGCRFLLGVVLLAAFASGPASARRDSPFVRTQGKWLVDEQGRVLMLHGVNVAESSKYPPFLPWQTRDDVMALKAAYSGRKCTRIPIQSDRRFRLKVIIDSDPK